MSIGSWHEKHKKGVRLTDYFSQRYVVAATTIWSGASYVYSKDAVKILHQNNKTSSPSAKEGEEAKKKDDKQDKQ